MLSVTTQSVISHLDKYTPLNWTELEATPRVEWLVPNFLACGMVYTLVAPAKAGKSLRALDVAAALVTGQPVFGQATTSKRVLYVDNENSVQDIAHRIHAMGHDLAKLENLSFLLYQTLPPHWTQKKAVAT